MSETHEPPVEFRRHCDVVVIGGSAAGLAGALMLARSRRSVIVVDDGRPRNAPAAHMHGYLGYEGRAPADLVAAGRDEVRRYGVEILEGRIDSVTGADGAFEARFAAGGAIVARKVLVATGAVDELPSIEGLADHWGGRVIHCPYCHGWEVRDQRIVVIGTNRWVAHQAGLFRQLSDRVAVFVHDQDLAGEVRDELAELDVTVDEVAVERVVEAADRSCVVVQLADGRSVEADAIAIATRILTRADMLAPLGLEPTEHPSGMGTVIDVDETGATGVDGVYAAGNATDPGLQVLHAAAAGSRVGAMINVRLVGDDRSDVGAGRVGEWDHFYDAEPRIWSGNPNGTLVAEVSDLEPGRALDVGCGEGADAVWLAERGWRVTGLDVARSALDRTALGADQRGVEIATVCSDVVGAGLGSGAFELVTLQYPAIPRTPGEEAIDALLAAVAPGGTLLVVGHDLGGPDDLVGDHDDDPVGDHDGRVHDHHDHAVAYDALAYVQVANVRSRLDPDEWLIEVDEVRDRPAGHVTHHVRDQVLRARRR